MFVREQLSGGSGGPNRWKTQSMKRLESSREMHFFRRLITGFYNEENTGLSLFASAVDSPAVEPTVVELMSWCVSGGALPAVADKCDEVSTFIISAIESPVEDHINGIGVYFALDL